MNNTSKIPRPGCITRGLACENVGKDIITYVKEDPAREDRENRKQVVDEIERLVKTGITIEEVCESLVEKYKDKFKYLPESSLPQIFAGWYNGRIREKREIEKGI